MVQSNLPKSSSFEARKQIKKTDEFLFVGIYSITVYCITLTYLHQHCMLCNVHLFALKLYISLPIFRFQNIDIWIVCFNLKFSNLEYSARWVHFKGVPNSHWVGRRNSFSHYKLMLQRQSTPFTLTCQRFCTSSWRLSIPESWKRQDYPTATILSQQWLLVTLWKMTECIFHHRKTRWIVLKTKIIKEAVLSSIIVPRLFLPHIF